MADTHFRDLFNVLESSKKVFWAENADLPEEARQSLWRQRFSELALRLDASFDPSNDACEATPAPRKKRMARSLSSGLPSPKRRETDSESVQAVQLERHLSSPSASVSTSETANSTWTLDQVADPMTPHTHLSQSPPPSKALTNSLTASFADEHQLNYSAYQKLPQSIVIPCQRNLSIEEYLSSASPTTSPSSLSPMPTSCNDMPSSMETTPVQQSLYSEYDINFQPGRSLPCSPPSITMTRATTLVSEPMSRAPTNPMMRSPLDLFRVGSSDSTEEYTAFSALGDDTKKMTGVSLFPRDFPSDTMFLSTNPALSSELSVPLFSSSVDPSFSTSVAMERPLSQSSNESSSSSSSTTSSHISRAARRTQEQIAQGARPIAPRAKKTTPTTAPFVRVPSADGKSKELAQIPKADSPHRPSRQRTFCDRCNDHPEGFHGEHELRRHIERLHSVVRRVWVCKDNSADGKFLANCKACRSGKTYGANYNAAAHLRRTHFHPCKKGRGGRGKPSEKRGGKGGGDDPPMEVLKDWMYQKEELVPVDDVNHSLISDKVDDHDIDNDNDNECDMGSSSSSEDDVLEVDTSMAHSATYTFGSHSNTTSEAAVPRHLATLRPTSVADMAAIGFDGSRSSYGLAEARLYQPMLDSFVENLFD